MIMKKILVFLLCLTCFSCERGKVIKYKYGSTTLTRVDTSGEIRIFYGDYKRDEYPDSYVKISYSGFNSGVSGLLVFNNDKTISVVPKMGFFEISGGRKDHNKITIVSEKEDLRDWFFKIKGNYNNIIQISDLKAVEIDENKINNSKVRSYY